MTVYTYKTKGTCSSYINLELEGNIIKKVEFVNGCHGNTKGIAKLVEGMTAEEIKKRLSGIQCGRKSTSCPDQLAKAVDEAIHFQKQEQR
jgi:uncharacterized protein (TIGR03905 family)